MSKNRSFILMVSITALVLLPQCKAGQIRLGADEKMLTAEPVTLHPGIEDAVQQEIPGIEGAVQQEIPGIEGAVQLEKKDCAPGQTIPCGSDVGECSKGTQACLDDEWGQCANAVGPAAEICDGKDNNCDGSVDEGCACGVGEEKKCGPENVGMCKGGKQICQGGMWSQCVGTVEPEQEVCDGFDNDCDGKTDEAEDLSPAPASLTFGVCQGQLMVCSGGKWQNPDYKKIDGYSADEQKMCDGKDNDCDGTVDEGCECAQGEVRACAGLKTGVCNPGNQACVNGFWGECMGATGPGREVCNGLDDDCDGKIDEELTAPNADLNKGICSGQLKVCGGSKGWMEPDYFKIIGYATIEDMSMCDGIDNDCDGAADEGCKCIGEETEQCGSTDVGVCKFGFRTCVNGAWGGCVDAVEPSSETCDDLDNDCNGKSDDGLTPPAAGKTAGVCAGLTKICAGTAGWIEPNYSENSLYEAIETKCDGSDNDCDGKKDVGCECTDGDTKICGTSLGACQEGTQICVGGKWQICGGSIEPQAEVCDGIDSNCNGLNDFEEGCECINGTKMACGSGVGECKKGERTCVSGEWSGACVGEVIPAAESCNNKDDDCDGETDEGIENPPAMVVTGVCAVGGPFMKMCVDGAWQDRDLASLGIEGYEADETSCDGKDNDCDGKVDEGCDCEFGAERPCPDHSEWCEAGVQHCVNGEWGECMGATPSLPEGCDGIDNDCNGIVDDVAAADLPLASVQDGVCAGAKQKCFEGQLVQPDFTSYSDDYEVNELACDGLDNDCDGEVDEGITLACSTACGSGVKVCSAGAFGGACDAPQPAKEICDGQDNDCNDKVDDGLVAPPADKNTGVCAGSVKVCAGVQNWVEPDYGSLGYKSVENTSMCDGLDNDCDGTVDEGCNCVDGQTKPCGSSDVGECMFGIQTCSNGEWGDCVGAVKPRFEECDGLDNNCDGVADNDISSEMMPFADKQDGVCAGAIKDCTGGVPVEPNYVKFSVKYEGGNETSCDGFDNDCDDTVDENIIPKDCQGYGCGAGKQACSNGKFGECDAPKPMPEFCDGLDNDCDDQIDEGLTQACSSLCGEGVETCSDGLWGNCTAKQPTTEVCDEVDNNCNGEIDEGCDCVDGKTQSCDSGVGECVAGTQLCANGQWGDCDGAVGPSAEDCDGKDNDCNTLDDDNIDPDTLKLADKQAGVCAGVKKVCSAGAEIEPNYTSVPNYQVIETKCDGLDNDCDGQTDEGITQVCSNTCGSGLKTCSDGVFGGCEVSPVVEACGSDIGECQAGTKTCANNQWGECVGEVGPSAEDCDGMDDDCDDVVDDGIVPIICVDCPTQRQECVNGSFTECQCPPPPPSPPDVPVVPVVPPTVGKGTVTSPGAGGVVSSPNVRSK